jgi:hypothetical protein
MPATALDYRQANIPGLPSADDHDAEARLCTVDPSMFSVGRLTSDSGTGELPSRRLAATPHLLGGGPYTVGDPKAQIEPAKIW